MPPPEACSIVDYGNSLEASELTVRPDAAADGNGVLTILH